jgi:hypothetical protein
MIWLCFMVLLLVGTQAHATTYYVAKAGDGGSDSNTCVQARTVTTPKLTIASARGCWVSGDTISIRAGTYTEVLAAQATTPSGTAGSQTTFTNYNSESVTIRPASGTPVDLNSKQYITISGLILDAVNNSNTDAIRLSGTSSSNLIVQDSQVLNAYGNGFGLTGSNHIVRRNLIYNNGRGWCSTTIGGHGVYYGAGSGSLFEYNRIYDNCGNGMQMYPSPTSATIQYNDFADNGTASGTLAGLVVANDNHIVRFNTFRRTSAGRHQKLGIQVSYSTPTGNLIEHNTVYDTGSGSTGGIFIGSDASSTIVRNNISLGHGSNNIVNQGASTTLTSNRTSGTASDIFVDATAAADLSLKSGSVAINAGTSCSRPYNGSSCDQGAFETFSTPTTAVASGNVVDVTIPMSLNTPVSPASAQTTWVVKFSGVARTTTSAIRLVGSDTIVRITFDGAACANTDTMTVDYTAGNVTDSVLIGNTMTQKMFTFTDVAVDETACTGGGGGSPPAGTTIVYHLNDGSGSTATDSSGNANHGTTTGSPSWTTGLVDGALDFDINVEKYVTAPYGSGVNPTSQSLTICMLVLPEGSHDGRIYFGAPAGTNQNLYVALVGGATPTWSIGIQGNTLGTNNEFPYSSGWVLPCVVMDSATDTATLWVNAVKGTTTSGNGASVKTYTSYTLAGNLTFGKANGFGSGTIPESTVDEIFIYPTALSQVEMTELYESLVTPTPPPTGTRTQKGHKFQRPYKTAGGAAEDFTSLNSNATVMQGGAIDWLVQTDCTGANCDPYGPRVYFSVDGGATYAQINDVCGVICFRGTSADQDLVSGTVTGSCLVGALTCVLGPTNFTTAAIPNIDLDQDSSFLMRYKFRIATDATDGQEIYLKLRDQNNNDYEGSAEPSALGAKLTVIGPSAGIGF